MTKVKCIIRQDWTTRDSEGWIIDRHTAVYVSNEDGTPTIYDSLTEARAEIIANFGYGPNRRGILHSHSTDEYSGNVHDGYVTIIREGSEEYAEATKQNAEPEPEPAAKSYTIVCTTKANRTEYLHAVTVEAANVTEAKKNAAAVIRDTLNRHAFAPANEGTKDANRSVNFCARRYGMTAAEVIEAARAPQGIDLYGAAPTEIVNEAMQEAEKALGEAAEAERKTTDAAIIYDTEAAAAHAADARRAAIAAEQAAAKAAAAARMTGASGDVCSIADIVSEYAAHARADADRATETAKQNAAEAEQRAEILAGIEDPKTRKYFTAHAIAHQWSAEETAQNLAYMQEISAANAAALALLDAYAETVGEYPNEDDDETRAAYRVAHDEITGTSQRATEYDRETVAVMVDIIARNSRRPDLSKYAGMAFLEFDDAPGTIYQRHELEAFLGDPDAYDVDAIEAEATAYDPAGRQVWAAFGEDLAAIAEQHELYQYSAI